MKYIRKTLEELSEADLYRELKSIESPQRTKVIIEGKEYILLSSNNYLGLASDERIINAAKAGLDKYGFGAGASRLISGTMSPHVELEEAIAKFKGAEAALIFNSGYCANLGLLTSLTGKNEVIFSDKLNHASIIDAQILSQAKVVRRYPHKDVEMLERYLQNAKFFSRRIIVTDGVFSMDGDIAPLYAIVKLANEHDALVIVDDAHGTGVLGKTGRGTLEYLGIKDDRVIQMGTFSKALGCFGAYVVGTKEFIDFLKNMARSFIYTTALPPSIAVAAMEALRIVEEGDDLRKKLFENVKFMRESLITAGYQIPNSESHIIPVMLGDVKRTLELSEYLFKNGVLIHAIRPPTVPKGTCRLRITPSALHTKEELEKATTIMWRFLKK